MDFKQAWRHMEAQGYRYGDSALNNVEMGWDMAHGKHKIPGGLTAPHIEAMFEVVSQGIVGTTQAKVKRVEHQDDGTLTVFIDHWPAPVLAAAPVNKPSAAPAAVGLTEDQRRWGDTARHLTSLPHDEFLAEAASILKADEPAAAARTALSKSLSAPTPTGASMEPVADGGRWVKVNGTFDALMLSLERADRKGYMPDALADEWEAFDWDEAASASPTTPEGTK